MENDNKLVVQLASGNRLVAEIYDGGTFPEEICIYIVGKETGLWLQDIAMISNDYNRGTSEQTKDCVRVMVFADKNNEDYTNVFEIGELNEDEELVLQEELV